MEDESKFYAQAKTIQKLFHFPDVHVNATVNEKRKVWLQTYVALCFIMTRYEIDGNSCSESDIQLAKNILAYLKNKNEELYDIVVDGDVVADVECQEDYGEYGIRGRD
jgi:hypothetical protein